MNNDVDRINTAGSSSIQLTDRSHEQVLLNARREHFDFMIQRKVFRPAKPNKVAEWRS